MAYSGGVDSSLLLFLGTRILGVDRCYGLFADTCLIGEETKRVCHDFAKSQHLQFYPHKLSPLSHSDFCDNTEMRCYICKKRTYSSFYSGFSHGEVLLDGTNLDDLKAHRPGFRVLEELGVQTPYLDCQISKDDIRALSYHLGLSVWDRLSESCLATRIEQKTTITLARLQRIEKVEKKLHQLGFSGCRIRFRSNELYITLQQGQKGEMIKNQTLKGVMDMGQRYNFTKVFLDLFEREGILPSLLDYIGFTGDIPPQKQFLGHFNNMSGDI